MKVPGDYPAIYMAHGQKLKMSVYAELYHSLKHLPTVVVSDKVKLDEIKFANYLYSLSGWDYMMIIHSTSLNIFPLLIFLGWL